ncbi:hypothetical protein BHE74_00039360 [Ensete ventricosum]|nr:hypothetical protein BHE74_00039360 [Ensete ventricosum]
MVLHVSPTRLATPGDVAGPAIASNDKAVRRNVNGRGGGWLVPSTGSSTAASFSGERSGLGVRPREMGTVAFEVGGAVIPSPGFAGASKV